MLKKWCEITSCNGIVDLMESKRSRNPYKFGFWIVVMILMVSACLWFTFMTVEEYVASPTVTKVSTVYTDMPFPEILICYNGGFDVAAMKAENLPDSLIEDLPMAFASDTFQYNSSQSQFIDYTSKKDLSIREVLGKFGYACSDMVSSFGTNFLKTDCKDATTLYGSQGKCHLLQKNGEQNWPGTTGGIFLELQQPKNSYYENYPEQAKSVKMSNSYSISIEKNFGLQQSEQTLFIPLNAQVLINLNLKRYVHLERQNNCITSPEFYNSNTCYIKCYNTETMRICNCVSVQAWDDALNSHGVKMCDPFSFSNACNISMLNWNNVLECQRRCKPICDESIFEYSQSYMLFDSAHSNNRSWVNVAFTTMQYTKVKFNQAFCISCLCRREFFPFIFQFEEVEAFSFSTAIANIGGQAGLWLGASIVTIVQAFYYLVVAGCSTFTSISSKIVPHVSTNTRL